MEASQDANRTREKIEGAIDRRTNLAIPLLLAIIGFFGIRSLDAIETAQASQGEKLEAVRTDVKVLNARIESSVLEQIKQLQSRVERLEQGKKNP